MASLSPFKLLLRRRFHLLWTNTGNNFYFFFIIKVNTFWGTVYHIYVPLLKNPQSFQLSHTQTKLVRPFNILNTYGRKHVYEMDYSPSKTAQVKHFQYKQQQQQQQPPERPLFLICAKYCIQLYKHLYWIQINVRYGYFYYI